MNPTNVLGLDIGGANVKFATERGEAGSQPFALWKTPVKLTDELRRLFERVSASESIDAVALTMTGELCDCFESKQEGVRFILKSVHSALDATKLSGRPVRVWTIEDKWRSLEESFDQPLIAAAANWLALAHFAGRYAPSGPALLVDIGSTTTDLVPLHDGIPMPTGRSDAERLLAGELVYLGAARTPIAMLVDNLPYRERRCPVAREVFATVLDAELLLERRARNADSETADGRPARREFARGRMARMLCLDADSFTLDDARVAAHAVRAAQFDLLRHSYEQVAARLSAPASTVVLSGSGESLASELFASIRLPSTSLTSSLGGRRSTAACAYALAVLAGERLRQSTSSGKW